MAFQKTGGRSVITQPTGVADLSGFKEAAQSYQSLANSAFEIGTDIRRRDFNEAILQAEADGKTSGVRYEIDKKTGEKKLVPLTNLDYGKATSLYSKSEQAEVLKAYRKAAIGAYTAHAVNQVNDMANDALAQKPNEPEFIRATASGYFDSLRELDQDIYSVIAPKAEAVWMEAENRANAQRQLEVKQEQVIDLTKQYKLNDSKAANLARKGIGADQETSEGIELIASELKAEQEGILENLQTLGVKPSELEKLSAASDLLIATASAEAHVERYWQFSEGSYSDSLKEVSRMIKSLRESDPTLDVDVVEQTMLSRLGKLNQIKTQELQEEEKMQTQIVGSVNLDILTGKDIDANYINGLSISEGRKASLLNTLSNYTSNQENKKKQLATAIQEQNNLAFDELMLPFEDEFGNETERETNSIVIEYMFTNGLVDANKYEGYIKATNRIVKERIKSKADLGLAEFTRMMSPDSGYKYETETLRAMIPNLIEDNIIGNLPGQITLAQAESKISAYASKKKTYEEDGRKARKSLNAVKNGDKYTSKDIENVQKFAPQLVADEDGNTLYHSDLRMRNQNIVNAANFTLAYGALHPDAEAALKGLSNTQSQEDFDVKMAVADTIFTNISKGSLREGTTELGMGELNALNLFRKHGIDIDKFEVARVLGYKSWSDMSKIDETVNSDRILRNLDNQYENLEEAVIQNFNESVEGSSITEYLINDWLPFWDTDNEEILTALDKLKATAPDGGVITGEMSDAMLNDQRLVKALTMGVKKQFQLKNIPVTDEGLKIAIRNSVLEIGDSVGISVDSAGNPYWTISPWYKEARETMGDFANTIGESFYDEVIDLVTFGAISPSTEAKYGTGVAGAVFSDIESRFNMLGGLKNPKAVELLEDGGTFFLVPNESRGVAQTYKVMIRDKDDPYDTAVVLPHYKYDFNNSIQNKALLAAIKRVENSTFHNFIGHIPLVGGALNQRQIKSELLDIIKDTNDKTMYEKALRFMDSVVGFVNPNRAGSIDYRVDEKDVIVLRDFLQGNINREEYIKELDKLYE